MNSGRAWRGPERTKYIVNLEIQKARVHRRPFWRHIYSQNRPPPVDTERFMDWLRHICDVKDVRLPAVLCVFRNHGEGEGCRFHYILKVLLSDEGFHVEKAYAGDRGIPHTRREEDFAWKFGSLPDNRLDVRRAVPFDPAARIRAPNLGVDLSHPPFNKPHPPVFRTWTTPTGYKPPRPPF
jgi:hypothetical protein